MPISVGDGISTAKLGLPSIEPTMLIIQGGLHVAYLGYMPNVNHWMLSIDKRGKRVFDRPHGSTANDARFVPAEIEHYENEKDYMGIAAAYPDTTPPKDSQRVFCLPIMRRKRTRALQREEFGYTTETVSGLMVLPERNGPLCQWRRIGCFDSLPDKAKVDWGKEYCYSEDYKMLFSEGPRGLDDTVIWLKQNICQRLQQARSGHNRRIVCWPMLDDCSSLGLEMSWLAAKTICCCLIGWRVGCTPGLSYRTPKGSIPVFVIARCGTVHAGSADLGLAVRAGTGSKFYLDPGPSNLVE